MWKLPSLLVNHNNNNLMLCLCFLLQVMNAVQAAYDCKPVQKITKSQAPCVIM